MDGYDGGNTTGFASPAADYLESRINLEAFLELRHPSRYLVRVVGQALASRAVRSGDVLVVDSATAPTQGKIAVVMIDGAPPIWCLPEAIEGIKNATARAAYAFFYPNVRL